MKAWKPRVLFSGSHPTQQREEIKAEPCASHLTNFNNRRRLSWAPAPEWTDHRCKRNALLQRPRSANCRQLVAAEPEIEPIDLQSMYQVDSFDVPTEETIRLD